MPDADSLPEHAAAVADLPTVEDELVLHQQQSVELAMSLTAEPDNPLLQEQLKESLEQVRRDATLVDDSEANDRAQAAIKMLSHLNAASSQEMLAEIITANAPVQSASEDGCCRLRRPHRIPTKRSTPNCLRYS